MKITLLTVGKIKEKYFTMSSFTYLLNLLAYSSIAIVKYFSFIFPTVSKVIFISIAPHMPHLTQALQIYAEFQDVFL